MIYFLCFTAFVVSIDSFFCGLSLSSAKKKPVVILGIALTVYLMCVLVNLFTSLFNEFLNENTANFGGIILIGVGIYNLLKKDEPTVSKNDNTLVLAILTGLAVGLDGACANLSLVLMGYSKIFTPLIIAIFHAVLIFLGILCSNTKLVKRLIKLHFVPPLILILLGLYKLTAFL